MRHAAKVKLIVGLIAIVALALGVVFVLKSEHALVMHPKGIIAQKELDLIKTTILLMLIVVVPTYVLLFLTAWKYRAKDSKPREEAPKTKHKARKELILWAIPSVVISAMAVITWDAAHELDPYKPLASDVKPLKIQVVALDWKWLFIYPEQGIATINLVEFPEQTPISFSLAADGSPMNSFWIPELSGQIYSMTGMTTQLHLMANGIGEYAGRAAEINGEGFADMTFVAKSTSRSDFERWVAEVKNSPLRLDARTYGQLIKPSQSSPVTLYADVKEGLFDEIVMKYMHHGH